MSPGIIVIALFVGTYGALAVVALRRPLLARLAYREVARRPWQSMLVVAGLTVGTSMLLMSFINSDSMTVTLTQATYQSWGRVDVLVSRNGAFFDRGVATGLADSPRLHGQLRGVQAGVELVGTVADLDRRLDNPTVRLVGFDPSTQSAFEAFTLTGGGITTGQDLPTDQVLVSKSLADSVQARTGDTLLVKANDNPPARFTVAAIARSEGPGAYGAQPAIFGTLAAMSALTGTDQINVVRISAPGDGPQEMENGKHIAPTVRAALRDITDGAGLQVRTAKADDVNEIVNLAESNRAPNLALSSIVVLAGIALVVNLALALAEERRPRLAILRAMGLSRTNLVLASVLEGAIYSIAAAAIGAIPGIAAGWLLVSQAGRWVPEIHEKNATVLLVVSVDAIVVAIASGALITLATLAVASIRTSRLPIASAVRALPDPSPPTRPSRLRRVGVVVLGMLGSAAVIVGNPPLRLVGGLGVIALVGLVLRDQLSDRARIAVVAVSTLAWIVVAFTALPESDIEGDIYISVATVAFAIAALSVLIATNMRVVERFVPRSLIAQLTRRPAKLSLATCALGLVLAMVAFIGMFLAISEPDYHTDSGGYAVSAVSMSAPSIALRPDLDAKVDGRLVMSSGTYFGPVRSSSSYRGPGPTDWHQQMLALYELTDSQLSSTRLPLVSREKRFANDGAVWASVRDSANLVISGLYRPGTTVDLIGASGPVRLEVAASFRPGFLAGLMGSASALSELASGPAGTTVLLRLKPGVDPASFALDIRRSLFPTGVDATTTQQQLDEGSAFLRNFAAEVQLLLTAGLGVGVVSFGLLAMRAVIERRRSIGLLRAVGFQPGHLLVAMIGESLLMATGGIVSGVIGGLGVGYLFFSRYYPGAHMAFQVEGLLLASALIYLTAIAVTIAPAMAIARTAPASALRLTD